MQKKWETYESWQKGFGLVSKYSGKAHLPNYDAVGVFGHKLSEKEQLTNEERIEIEKDCKDLVKLLEKFYFEDGYGEIKESD